MKQDETGTSEKPQLPDEDADKEMIGGCCVCADDNGTSDNLLVYCDGVGCRVAVHEACYGIRNLPEGEWFCRSCEHRNRLAADSKLTPTELSAAYLAICCQFCPLREGALKICDNGKWSHVVCALYIPEVTFGSLRTMEPIITEKITPERYNKKCSICELNGDEEKPDLEARNHNGHVYVQCRKLGCKHWFHVTCAQMNGLLCEEATSQTTKNVNYVIYCKYHCGKLAEGQDNMVRRFPSFKYWSGAGAEADTASKTVKRKTKDLPVAKKKPRIARPETDKKSKGRPPKTNEGKNSIPKEPKKPKPKPLKTETETPKPEKITQTMSVGIKEELVPSSSDSSIVKIPAKRKLRHTLETSASSSSSSLPSKPTDVSHEVIKKEPIDGDATRASPTDLCSIGSGEMVTSTAVMGAQSGVVLTPPPSVTLGESTSSALSSSSSSSSSSSRDLVNSSPIDAFGNCLNPNVTLLQNVTPISNPIIDQNLNVVGFKSIVVVERPKPIAPPPPPPPPPPQPIVDKVSVDIGPTKLVHLNEKFPDSLEELLFHQWNLGANLINSKRNLDVVDLMTLIRKCEDETQEMKRELAQLEKGNEILASMNKRLTESTSSTSDSIKKPINSSPPKPANFVNNQMGTTTQFGPNRVAEEQLSHDLSAYYVQHGPSTAKPTVPGQHPPASSSSYTSLGDQYAQHQAHLMSLMSSKPMTQPTTPLQQLMRGCFEGGNSHNPLAAYYSIIANAAAMHHKNPPDLNSRPVAK